MYKLPEANAMFTIFCKGNSTLSITVSAEVDPELMLFGTCQEAPVNDDKDSRSHLGYPFVNTIQVVGPLVSIPWRPF